MEFNGGINGKISCQWWTSLCIQLVGGFNHLEKYDSMGRIIP